VGVIVSRTLKSSSRCVAAAKSANRILGMVGRTFVNKDSKTTQVCINCISRWLDQNLNTAYRHGVRYLQKDIDLLEKVRKRATRLMIKDRNLSYSERLTLETS